MRQFKFGGDFGNQYLAHQFYIAHQDYNFTKNDRIDFTWSLLERFDWYIDRSWSHSNQYDNLPEMFYTSFNFLVRDISTMYGIMKLLDRLECDHHHYWPDDMLTNLTQEELNHPEVEPLISYVKQKI